jgi:hypothetical protein
MNAYLISFLPKCITLSILTHPYWLPQCSWLTAGLLIACNYTYLSGFEFVWQFGMDLAYSLLFNGKREYKSYFWLLAQLSEKSFT